MENEAKRAVFPFFKNVMLIDQDTIVLEGVTVYSIYADKVFLPRQAAESFSEY